MQSTSAIPESSSVADEYRRDGVATVRSLLAPQEVDEIREIFMAEISLGVRLGWDDKVPDSDVLARYPRIVQPHRRVDTEVGRLARRYMLDERLVGLASCVSGPVLGAQSMFYFKPPKARGQALHQDNASLKVEPGTCLAAWIAIDDADAANGGLVVVPGSHRLELGCLEPADPEDSFASAGVRVPAGFRTVQTELRAGDVLLFHGNLIHGSHRNDSDRFRRALIFHYVPASSVRIAQLYQPLLAPEGREVLVEEALGGGPCGEGFVAEP